jgi:hypothetical protein
MRALDRITPGSLAGAATVAALQSDPDDAPCAARSSSFLRQ